MRAWRVTRPGPMAAEPLHRFDEATPVPSAGELLVRVLACGVCRTDLHVSEGDLAVHRPSVVPGHEVRSEDLSRIVDGRPVRQSAPVTTTRSGFPSRYG